MSNINNKHELPPPVLRESLQSLVRRGLINLSMPATASQEGMNPSPTFPLWGQAGGPMPRGRLAALLDEALDMLNEEDFNEELPPPFNANNQNRQ